MEQRPRRAWRKRLPSGLTRAVRRPAVPALATPCRWELCSCPPASHAAPHVSRTI